MVVINELCRFTVLCCFVVTPQRQSCFGLLDLLVVVIFVVIVPTLFDVRMPDERRRRRVLFPPLFVTKNGGNKTRLRPREEGERKRRLINEKRIQPFLLSVFRDPPLVHLFYIHSE